MRILLVDDDPEIVRFVSRVLQSDGHVVESASRGAEALTGALGGEFDLLICDLMLPDLSGTEVIRAIKAQSPAMPVMVISARDPAEEKEACVAAGATGYLQKPLRVQDLRDEVSWVEQSRAELRVLLVDPDPVACRDFARELGQQGCQVAVCGDVKEALDRIALEPPHIVLIDASLPEVMRVIDGAAAIAIPVFACSAPGHETDDELMRSGVAMILDKPVDPEAFMLQARFLIS